MAESTINANEFFNEVGYGEIRVHIVDGKLCSIPKQVIERPGKAGALVRIYINEPINLRIA